MIASVLTFLIAEVIFRFLLAHREEPYASCGIKGMASTDGQVQGAFNTLRRAPCCVAGIAPLLKYALAPDLAGASAVDKYRVGHDQWNLRCEPSNIPREKLHAEQRFQSKSCDRKPASFANQAATSVAGAVERLHYLRGGRSLQHETSVVCAAFKDSVSGEPTHSRPTQIGNPAFAWISERLPANLCLCCWCLLLVF